MEPNISLPLIPRILTRDALRKPYQKRTEQIPEINHWGQRKLFLLETEFLTRYSDPEQENIVIYPGSAPGIHIPYLAELFPHCQFILFDPAPFSLSASSQIEVYQEYFTHQTAQDLREKYRSQTPSPLILMMSDIRTANWKEMNFDQNEETIEKDNQAQFDWCRLLEPDKALLKFRLPYVAGETAYFAGDLYLSPWGPTRTTETRLVPHATRETWQSNDYYTTWDHRIYEEQMYYFNTETRMKEIWNHNVRGEGLNKAYDSAAEVHILKEYLDKYQAGGATLETLARMSYTISRRIVRNSNRTLLNKKD